MPLGLQVPKCLVGLTQPGENETKRFIIVINDTMACDPSVDELMWMLDTRPELRRPGIVIKPKVITLDKLSGKSRGLN
jgi:hypothetical protein